eukprot:TRINITY_DN28936_c0_g1_i1.p1 TRINITY_DN28936_c0_g1~~TRINITY_DN28936_c0_g1_i1.p1  ORF type:complete len:126 (+),score=51.93 TRINITY_DN28936_c0_g1_i1:22-378(+)
MKTKKKKKQKQKQNENDQKNQRPVVDRDDATWFSTQPMQQSPPRRQQRQSSPEKGEKRNKKTKQAKRAVHHENRERHRPLSTLASFRTAIVKGPTPTAVSPLMRRKLQEEKRKKIWNH